MSPLLTNYSFLSPLKRQYAVRNRSNNATPSPSKYANRLPVLPELSRGPDNTSPSVSSLTPLARPSHCAGPSEKRRSRYGREEFTLNRDFLRATTLDASSPAPSKQRHQSVRLSDFDFDIVIDITSPTSPVSDSPPLAETTPPRPIRSRKLRQESPPRSRSPTPSLTSMSVCSSTDVPTTPLTSDDDWPGLDSSPQLRKAPAAQRVQIQPLVIAKSSSALHGSDASSATVFEFTLAPCSVPDEGDEDDASWYARELGQVVSLSSPYPRSSSSARPDSLLPPPSRGSSASITRTPPRSRISKPLPALPGPSPQLDPTLPPRRTSRRLVLPSALPPPAYPLPAPPRTPTAPSVRKSLKITVPRAPPRTPLPLDVADIFDDIDAWSVVAPSAGLRSTITGTGVGAELSPPRIPLTARSASYSEYDPVEFIVDYAAQPSPQPSPSLSSFFPGSAAESECRAIEERLRSRWSCSTPGAAPSSPSASSKLRFHLGSVARRVRTHRIGAGACGDIAVPKMHVRSSSEPTGDRGADGEGAVAGVFSDLGHEEADAESCLRRKPIPLELFLR